MIAGSVVGFSVVGAPVDGVTVATTVGNLVGLNVGISTGARVKVVVGARLGSSVNALVEWNDGSRVDAIDGSNDGWLKTVIGVEVGAAVGSVLWSVVIDDDLILFVSFNCFNWLAWVWSVERSLAIKLYDQ